jgi:hypothetical protein
VLMSFVLDLSGIPVNEQRLFAGEVQMRGQLNQYSLVYGAPVTCTNRYSCSEGLWLISC